MDGSSQFYCQRPLSGTNKQRSGPRISEVRNAAIISFVSNLHDPGNISISNQSCQKASERQILLDRINCIEQMATESLTSRELLEAKIFPAPDMLMHSCAYTPAKYNKRYICKDLIHPATITIPGFTLDIHVDIEKLARDAAQLFLNSEEQDVLSDEHMIYCTPVKSSGRSQHIALSFFLQQILLEIRKLCFCKPDRKRIWSENFQLVDEGVAFVPQLMFMIEMKCLS